MSLVIFYALIFVVIPLGLYFLFAYIVLFHMLKYAMEKSFSKKAALVFCFGLLAISLMVIQKFAVVNWKRVSLTQFIENSDINLFYGNYDRR